MTAAPALNRAAVASLLRPRNAQVDALIARIGSRLLQRRFIRHWNAEKRLPDGFLSLPLFSPDHRGSIRREIAV